MKNIITFVTIRRGQALSNETLGNPLVEAADHAKTNGFPLFRPFPKGTAYPTQGRKCHDITIIRTHGTLANIFAMLLSINLLKFFQGLTCKPVRTPKLYYTDTSFDAIGRVSQFSLGGRGLTYFFLTCCLPFPIFCNSLTLTYHD